MTKDELAKKKGLKVYDCALPQTWLDGVVQTLKKTGFGRMGMLPTNLYDRILSGTVWCYDGPGVMGRPYALTDEALGLLRTYEDHMGIKELCQ